MPFFGLIQTLHMPEKMSGGGEWKGFNYTSCVHPLIRTNPLKQYWRKRKVVLDGDFELACLCDTVSRVIACSE